MYSKHTANMAHTEASNDVWCLDSGCTSHMTGRNEKFKNIKAEQGKLKLASNHSAEIKEFPFSMENIPRQKSFACLSLKFGCIISALIIILYSVLSLAQCTAVLGEVGARLSPENVDSMLTFGLVVTVTIVHAVTLLLTAIMLVGTLREKPQLMRPWVVWTSIQVIVYLMLFVFWTTMSVINHAGGDSILLYVVELMSLLLRFYMLMLGASYYKQLEEEQCDGERLKTLVNQEAWYNSA